MDPARADNTSVVLRTERLVLRRLTMDDLDPLAVIYADPEVRRFFPEGVLTRDQTREEIEWMLEVDYPRYGYGLWATMLRDTGELIGRCGLLPWPVVTSDRAALGLEGPEEHPTPGRRVEVEIAYLLGAAHWRRGLATEAARAIASLGFATLEVDRLICLIDEANVASLGVAAKLGMTVDGDVEIDGEVFPLYAVARDRWVDASSSRPCEQGVGPDDTSGPTLVVTSSGSGSVRTATSSGCTRGRG
jgi:RimJ/RimL family protein N-acetyltransferase